MCPLIYLSFPLIGVLLHEFNRSLLDGFLIVELVFDAEILRSCFSPCKLSKNLLLVFIKVTMSKQCFVK